MYKWLLVLGTGDIGRRICTAAEMKFYLNAFFFKSSNPGYLQQNGNCNLTSWVSGCEPGWACSVDPTEQVDLQNSKDFPERTINCMSCCEGFFCPRGLTCMIRKLFRDSVWLLDILIWSESSSNFFCLWKACPLGAHCPLATLNERTSLCEPWVFLFVLCLLLDMLIWNNVTLYDVEMSYLYRYTYQLPPGRPNHTCGGANVWADIRSSGEVFCSAGSYCPTTTRKVACDSGYSCLYPFKLCSIMTTYPQNAVLLPN